MIYNDLQISVTGTQYLPKYFYAGANTLRSLDDDTLGEKIMELPEENIDLYCFFDVPQDVVENQNFSLDQLKGTSVAGKDIYTKLSYSPEYFLTSLDKGFQFCQKVSEFVGASSEDKEYPVQQCLDAANGKFYPEMHAVIVAYALDLYL